MNTVEIEQIKAKITPILKEEGVIRSALFGSLVRGENTEDSDIDMLVELPLGKSLLDLIGLQFRLEETLEKKVDVLTYRSLSPYLKDRILKEQVPIYEKRS